MTLHGRFYWNELITRDVEQAKDFYHDTMGWEYEPMPMESGGIYWLVPGDPTLTCDMYQMADDDFDSAGDHWLSYISVDDIEKRVELVRSGGATLTRDPWDVPGVGRIATLREPGGALIGWMTPARDG